MEGKAAPEAVRLAQATENCDIPVAVTTAVQFFESLYSSRPSQSRKLHNIAQSVIIFDKAQMLPLPYLRPCIYAIARLIERYSVSAVLCTATQPALVPIFQEFLPQITPVELCPSDTCQWEPFRRSVFHRFGVLTWQTPAKQLNKQDQVLCIVNTRKSAHELFCLLKRDGNFQLSTLMYPAHRQAQLAEICRRLRSGLPCRVVSTSLMEVGVDVDFPAVWREENDLDAILLIFRQGSELGCAPALKLFEAVQIARRHSDDPAPTRSYQDYLVTVAKDALPVGIICQRMCCRMSLHDLLYNFDRIYNARKSN